MIRFNLLNRRTISVNRKIKVEISVNIRIYRWIQITSKLFYRTITTENKKNTINLADNFNSNLNPKLCTQQDQVNHEISHFTELEEVLPHYRFDQTLYINGITKKYSLYYNYHQNLYKNIFQSLSSSKDVLKVLDGLSYFIGSEQEKKEYITSLIERIQSMTHISLSFTELSLLILAIHRLSHVMEGSEMLELACSQYIRSCLPYNKIQPSSSLSSSLVTEISKIFSSLKYIVVDTKTKQELLHSIYHFLIRSNQLDSIITVVEDENLIQSIGEAICCIRLFSPIEGAFMAFLFKILKSKSKVPCTEVTMGYLLRGLEYLPKEYISDYIITIHSFIKSCVNNSTQNDKGNGISTTTTITTTPIIKEDLIQNIFIGIHRLSGNSTSEKSLLFLIHTYLLSLSNRITSSNIITANTIATILYGLSNLSYEISNNKLLLRSVVICMMKYTSFNTFWICGISRKDFIKICVSIRNLSDDFLEERAMLEFITKYLRNNPVTESFVGSDIIEIVTAIHHLYSLKSNLSLELVRSILYRIMIHRKSYTVINFQRVPMDLYENKDYFLSISAIQIILSYATGITVKAEIKMLLLSTIVSNIDMMTSHMKSKIIIPSFMDIVSISKCMEQINCKNETEQKLFKYMTQFIIQSVEVAKHKGDPPLITSSSEHIRDVLQSLRTRKDHSQIEREYILSIVLFIKLSIYDFHLPLKSTVDIIHSTDKKEKIKIDNPIYFKTSEDIIDAIECFLSINIGFVYNTLMNIIIDMLPYSNRFNGLSNDEHSNICIHKNQKDKSKLLNDFIPTKEMIGSLMCTLKKYLPLPMETIMENENNGDDNQYDMKSSSLSSSDDKSVVSAPITINKIYNLKKSDNYLIYHSKLLWFLIDCLEYSFVPKLATYSRIDSNINEQYMVLLPMDTIFECTEGLISFSGTIDEEKIILRFLSNQIRNHFHISNRNVESLLNIVQSNRSDDKKSNLSNYSETMNENTLSCYQMGKILLSLQNIQSYESEEINHFLQTICCLIHWNHVTFDWNSIPEETLVDIYTGLSSFKGDHILQRILFKLLHSKLSIPIYINSEDNNEDVSNSNYYDNNNFNRNSVNKIDNNSNYKPIQLSPQGLIKIGHSLRNLQGLADTLGNKECQLYLNIIVSHLSYPVNDFLPINATDMSMICYGMQYINGYSTPQKQYIKLLTNLFHKLLSQSISRRRLLNITATSIIARAVYGIKSLICRPIIHKVQSYDTKNSSTRISISNIDTSTNKNIKNIDFIESTDKSVTIDKTRVFNQTLNTISVMTSNEIFNKEMNGDNDDEVEENIDVTIEREEFLEVLIYIFHSQFSWGNVNTDIDAIKNSILDYSNSNNSNSITNNNNNNDTSDSSNSMNISTNSLSNRFRYSTKPYALKRRMESNRRDYEFTKESFLLVCRGIYGISCQTPSELYLLEELSYRIKYLKKKYVLSIDEIILIMYCIQSIPGKFSQEQLFLNQVYNRIDQNRLKKKSNLEFVSDHPFTSATSANSITNTQRENILCNSNQVVKLSKSIASMNLSSDILSGIIDILITEYILLPNNPSEKLTLSNDYRLSNDQIAMLCYSMRNMTGTKEIERKYIYAITQRLNISYDITHVHPDRNEARSYHRKSSPANNTTAVFSANELNMISTGFLNMTMNMTMNMKVNDDNIQKINLINALNRYFIKYDINCNDVISMKKI